MMVDTCIAGVAAAASSTPASRMSVRSTAPLSEDRTVTQSPASSPNKSGEVGGGWWYVA